MAGKSRTVSLLFRCLKFRAGRQHFLYFALNRGCGLVARLEPVRPGTTWMQGVPPGSQTGRANLAGAMIAKIIYQGIP